MSDVRISVRTAETAIDIEESSPRITGSDVPALLGTAARRVCDALGGDRLNTVRAVAEAMGVRVEYVTDTKE